MQCLAHLHVDHMRLLQRPQQCDTCRMDQARSIARSQVSTVMVCKSGVTRSRLRRSKLAQPAAWHGSCTALYHKRRFQPAFRLPTPAASSSLGQPAAGYCSGPPIVQGMLPPESHDHALGRLDCLKGSHDTFVEGSPIDRMHNRNIAHWTAYCHAHAPGLGMCLHASQMTVSWLRFCLNRMALQSSGSGRFSGSSQPV